MTGLRSRRVLLSLPATEPPAAVMPAPNWSTGRPVKKEGRQAMWAAWLPLGLLGICILIPSLPERPAQYRADLLPRKITPLPSTLSKSAGLTPPTTPPHKASQENPFKASLKTKLSSCSSSVLACKRARLSELGPGALAPAPGASGGGPTRKGPEQTELYAQLSKASTALPYSVTQHTVGGGLEEHRST
ncbi:Peroxisome proliferator-activated receptor gamma coactivator 1-alpha, partial [Nibea albiflora]